MKTIAITLTLITALAAMPATAFDSCYSTVGRFTDWSGYRTVENYDSCLKWRRADATSLTRAPWRYETLMIVNDCGHDLKLESIGLYATGKHTVDWREPNPVYSTYWSVPEDGRLCVTFDYVGDNTEWRARDRVERISVRRSY